MPDERLKTDDPARYAKEEMHEETVALLKAARGFFTELTGAIQEMRAALQVYIAQNQRNWDKS